MKRFFVPALAAIAMAGAFSFTMPHLVAQSRAKAVNVPTIPHEAVPNFFKNPPGIYTGENMGIATNSKGNIYIYHRANETRLFEYHPRGKFIREIGRNNYGFAFAHSVRVDAQDNIWTVDEGTDMLVKFSPEGKVLMTIGRREDPVAMLGNMPGAGRLPWPQREVPLRPRDRRRLGSAGQHLRRRRLLRRARRQVRQERPVRQGRRQTRPRQPRVQHAALDRHRLPGQRLRRRSRQRARAGARQRPELEGELPERRQPVGGVRVWRTGPEESRQAVPVRRPTRGPTARRPRSAEFTGEVYKMELDGTIIGKFGKGGKALGEFSTIHQMDCRDPERHLHGGDQQLALAEDPAQAAGDHARPARTRRQRMTRTFKGFVAAALLAFGGSLARPVGARRDRVRQQRRSAEDAGRRLRRRGRRRRAEFEGPDLRLHAHRTSVRDARRQPHVLAGGSRLFQFDQTGKFVRELGQDVYGFNAAYRPAGRSAGQRLDDRRGASQVVKFDPDGRVALVLGRKPEAIGVRPAPRPAAAAGSWRRRTLAARGSWRRRARAAVARGGGARRRRWRAGPEPARPARRSIVRPTSPGTRPATSTSPTASATTNRIAKFNKDGNFLKQWGSTGDGAGPVQRPEGARRRRAGQRLRRRCRQQAHPGVRRRRHVQVAVRRRRHAAGDVHDDAARRSISTSPTPAIRTGWRMRRSTRCRSTARWSASSDRPAGSQRSSVSLTRSTAATRTNCWSAR